MKIPFSLNPCFNALGLVAGSVISASSRKHHLGHRSGHMDGVGADPSLYSHRLILSFGAVRPIAKSALESAAGAFAGPLRLVVDLEATNTKKRVVPNENNPTSAVAGVSSRHKRPEQINFCSMLL